METLVGLTLKFIVIGIHKVENIRDIRDSNLNQ